MNKDCSKEIKNGVVNRGYDYENLVPAFLALKLFHDDSISDFSLTLNPSSFRKFDDLRIDVEYRDGKKLSYLFQLKHRERGKEIQNASIFESGNNKRFDLQEYLKSYNKITKYGQKKTCIIYTNIQFTELDQLQRYEVSMINNVEINIFDTSTSLHPNSIYKFQDRTTEVSDKFYDNFFLLSNQKDVPDLQESIIKMFKDKYDADEDTAKLYMYFFQELRLQRQDTDNIVTKNDIVLQFLKLLLKTSVVVGCATAEHDENVKLIQNIFQQFDITLLEDCDEHLIPKCCLRNQEPKDEEQILFVRVDEISKSQIVSIVHLCKRNKLKIKFVLVGKVDMREDFSEYKIFQNLNNLEECNYILYKEFASKAKLSLQGRKEISLEELATRYNLHLQHFLTPNEIFNLIKGNLIIGDKLKEKPEPYIPRLLLDEDSNEVKDSAISFENQLNVICGEPGYGKTTLMKCLSVCSPEDHWVVNINAKEFSWVFKNECKLENILQYLFYKEYHRNIKEIFRKKAKIIFFFDALDELNSDCQKQAYEAIKKLAREHFKIWMFFRCDIKSVPIFDSGVKVSKYVIKDFEAKEQKKYITERLKYVNNMQEKMEAFEKLNNESTELRELLKVPLYLYIMTQIMIENNYYVQQIKNIANLYDCFIKGRIKHYLTKNGKEFDEVWEEFQEYYLEQYQIAALKSCLELRLFKCLPVSNNKKFISKIKDNDGDTLGIVRKVAKDTLVFHHHTYGEYFTALWLVENFDKVPVSQRGFILQEKYSNIKHFCDLKFAEEFPLDCVTLYCYATTTNRSDLLEKAIVKGPYNTTHLIKTYSRLAAKDGFQHVLDSLIKHGADIEDATAGGETLLHEAARHGNTAVVTFLLNHKKDLLEVKDSMGKTPLHLAAQMDHPEIIKILHENGANINAVDNFKRTPLHYASYVNRTTIVKYLISNGAEVNKQDEDEVASLHRAAQKGQIRIVRYLVGNKADVNIRDRYKWTPLHFAARNNHLRIVKFLVNAMEDIECIDEDGKTAMDIATDMGLHDIVNFFKDINKPLPRKSDAEYKNDLHLAAETGNLDQIKAILDSGANINNIDKSDHDKNTILHIAAFKGHRHIVDFLLNNNAKTSIKNHYGRTPLHLAAQMGHVSIVKSLTEENSENLTITDKWGLLPLHRASYKGHVEVIEFFLEKGLDVNTPGLKGGTALHSAARDGRINVINYLIDKGANLKAKDKTKKTCLHLATQECRVDAVKYLLKQDISLLDERDINGRTALHRAAENRNLDLVKCLVKAGANIEIVNIHNQTPLAIAKIAKQNRIIEYLQEEQLRMLMD